MKFSIKSGLRSATIQLGIGLAIAFGGASLEFIGLGFARASAAELPDRVSTELGSLAQRIIEVTGKGRTYKVSGFQGPSSGGPELQVKLSQQLELLDAQLDPLDFEIEIRGRFEQIEGDRGVIGVKIVVQLFEETGRPVIQLDGEASTLDEEDLSRNMFDNEATPRLLGIMTDVSPNTPEPQRSREMEEDRQAPPIQIRESIVTDEAGQYGIEILVKNGSDYEVRTLETMGRRQLPFVPLDLDDVYAVRLLNYTPFEASVLLTIDGINVFTFLETENPAQRRLIPAANGSEPGVTLIRGWKRNENESFEFKVTEFPETAAAKLHIEPNPEIGQITAQFAAAWAEGAEPPDGEGGTRGTGFGEQIEDRTTSVLRYIGNVRATLIVRYER